MAISHSDLNQQLLYSPPIYQLALPQQHSSGVHRILSHIHASFAATPASSVPLFTTRAYIRYNLPYILCLRLHTTRLMRKNGIEIRIKDEVDEERGQRSILFIHGRNNHSLPALSADAPYPYQSRVASRPFWLMRTTRMSSLGHNQ